jgi:hypothetical protein
MNGRDELAREIAYVRCCHRRRIEGPCPPCVGGVSKSLRTIRPERVELLARTETKLDGFDCPPTALTKSWALDLLKVMVPAIRGGGSVDLEDTDEL